MQKESTLKEYQKLSCTTLLSNKGGRHKEISEYLTLSLRTVKFYVQNIKKFN